MRLKIKTVFVSVAVSMLLIVAPTGPANANTLKTNSDISQDDWKDYCKGMGAVDVLHVVTRVFEHPEEAYFPLSMNEAGSYYPPSPTTDPEGGIKAMFVPCQAIIALNKENKNDEETSLNLQLLNLKEVFFSAYQTQKAADNVSFANKYAISYYEIRAKEDTAAMLSLGAAAAFNGKNTGFINTVEEYIDEIFKQNLTTTKISEIQRIVYWHFSFISAQDAWVDDIDDFLEVATGKKFYGKFLTKTGIPKSGKVIVHSYTDLLGEVEGIGRWKVRVAAGQGFANTLVAYNAGKLR